MCVKEIWTLSLQLLKNFNSNQRFDGEGHQWWGTSKKGRCLHRKTKSKTTSHGFRNLCSGQEERAGALTSHSSGNVQELDVKCDSMMENTLTKCFNGLPLYKCKSCGKEGMNNDVKRHIGAQHLEGIFLPCNSCEETFKTRRALSYHLTKDHQ